MAVELTMENWGAEVIEHSRTQPVLVDFWAPWCGPCLQLAPVLERLEQGANGRWVLAKANVEAHPELGSRHAVKAIPALKLFVDGAAIAETAGAHHELQLRAWLDTVLPGEERGHLVAARAADAAGDLATARTAYESALAAKAMLPEATIGLASILARTGEGTEALSMLEGQVGAAAASARLLARGSGGPPLEAARVAAGSKRAVDLLVLGLAAAAAGHPEEALAALLEVVKMDRALEDDGGRLAMLDVFESLGPDSSIADEWRRKLGAVLH